MFLEQKKIMKMGLNVSQYKKYVPMITQETVEYFKSWGNNGDQGKADKFWVFLSSSYFLYVFCDMLHEAKFPSPFFCAFLLFLFVHYYYYFFFWFFCLFLFLFVFAFGYRFYLNWVNRNFSISIQWYNELRTSMTQVAHSIIKWNWHHWY